MYLRTIRLLLGLVLLASLRAFAAPSAPTIIILDASWSMNELIGGETKIAIAQRAVHELVAPLPAETTLGLVAYSHRRAGCDDIELLIPPGPLDKAALLKAVDALKPRGQTPLSAALRFAVDALGVKEERATVILVSDGLETCGGNPCLTASELSRDHPGLTIHAVGFDLSARDGRKFACIPEASKGRFLQANDAASLKDALGFAVAEAMALPAPPPEEVLTPATLTVPASVFSGAQFSVGWTGPKNPGDYITIVPKGAADDAYAGVAYSRQGTPLELTALADAGLAEVRYVTARSHTVLARAPIEVLGTTATLAAPDEVTAGARVVVEWTGPCNAGDFITIVPKAAPDGDYAGVERVRKDHPAEATAPIEPGDCEVRYVTGPGRRVLARRPIKVVPAVVTLDAPAEAVAGTVVTVVWTGPANNEDFLTIVPIASPDGRSGSRNPVRSAAPVKVTAPIEPGDHEIRYVSGLGAKVLARRLIKVVPALVTLDAPAEAVAGTVVPVVWTGPANNEDFLTIVPIASPDGRSAPRTLLRPGAAAKVTVPIESGDHEIRYASGQGAKILARRPIKVIAASVTLDAPAEATAGSVMIVTWTGPANNEDFLTIVPIASPDGRSGLRTPVRPGAPAKVTVPIDPGDHEIRYVSGQGAKILARRPLRIVAAAVTLAAPVEVMAASNVTVEWTGPANNEDYLTIVPAAAPDGRSGPRMPLRPGTSAKMTTPVDSGDCEIRYMSGQGQRVLARRSLKVVPAVATLMAPDQALAGTTIEISWTGPGHREDEVTILPVGSPDNKVGPRAEIWKGTTLRIDTPKEAGAYEIRYLSGPARRVVARRSLQLTASR